MGCSFMLACCFFWLFPMFWILLHGFFLHPWCLADSSPRIAEDGGIALARGVFEEGPKGASNEAAVLSPEESLKLFLQMAKDSPVFLQEKVKAKRMRDFGQDWKM